MKNVKNQILTIKKKVLQYKMLFKLIENYLKFC